jgi:hypothetical protein
VGFQHPLHTKNFVLQALFSICSRTHTDACRNARRSHCVEYFVTSLDGRKHCVPVAFDIGPIGVKNGFQTSFPENTFALGHLPGDGNTDSNRDYTQIDNGFHGLPPCGPELANASSVSSSHIVFHPLPVGGTFHVQAIGMLQLNLGHTGLTEAFRLSRMAADHGVPVTVRVGESVGPQLAAAVQFAAAAIPNSRVSSNPKQTRTASCVASNPIRLLNGKYVVSSDPGLGITIEEPELHWMEIPAA